jgi:hypothetical protein
MQRDGGRLEPAVPAMAGLFGASGPYAIPVLYIWIGVAVTVVLLVVVLLIFVRTWKKGRG